ncbi:MAG: ribosome silencing factor [Lachnospiraceae bacterium]|nr:ribosome silencing factor [Lachnospiraceae bacterium]
MTEQAKMAKIVYEALDDKKGYDIKVIDISEITMIADYFVIASGGSSNQIQALINNVEEQMEKNGYTVKRIEGNKNSTWVLMDFGDVIVHIFDKEDRLFYDLERIWSDGKLIDIESL